MVGTPGRIKDHLENNKLNLTKLKHVVLDEVDQMLDMGFAEQVEEILGTSYKKGKSISKVVWEEFKYRFSKWIYQGSRGSQFSLQSYMLILT